ncbi:hypothetical protein ACFSJ3_17055 [Corallincola platygyrae]|uniref:Uncharacterized protein n=1 Tax=Corallincola platygyrae TaxID=1193278 RepID=A0ABW4XQ81_9GAMM
MRKVLMVVLACFSLQGVALERKELSAVSINEITADTQAQFEGAGDSHVAFSWWVPYEYWKSVLTRDPNITQAMKKQMLSVLIDYSVIAVVQADISPLGAFNFYSREEMTKSMRVTYTAAGAEEVILKPDLNVDQEMQLLMAQFGPILKAAMGQMGANFHFYIYRDVDGKGKRLLDPYATGNLEVTVKTREGIPLNASFDTPLNSLFVPRVCPNGELAHVSWNYCPWSGKKL